MVNFFSQSSQRDESSYHLIRYKPDRVTVGGAVVNKAKRFPFSGRFLRIHQINGSGHIQVRFGSNAPWISVFKGMTLECEYKEVWIRDASQMTGAFGARSIVTTEVIAYASWTKLVHDTAPITAIRYGSMTLNGLTATNTIQLLGDVLGTTKVTDRMDLGVIKLKNTDIGATLYFGFWWSDAAPFALGQWGYPIFAGESETIILNGSSGPYLSSEGQLSTFPAGSGDRLGLCVATDSPSCQFACLLSPGSNDLSDPGDNANMSLDG